MLTFVDIEVEDQDRALTTHNIKVHPTMRRWSPDLYDREQTIKDETNLHNEERRREDKDRGDMINQDNILIKLTGVQLPLLDGRIE